MISVCMATYNGEEFINQQITSILKQLSSDDELIISDDGSTDRTLDIINEINDDRIKLLNHKPNELFSGHERATANFENALKFAHGDYIFFSDQDDIWCEKKVDICLEALKKKDFIVHNMMIIDNENKLKSPARYLSNPILNKTWLSLVVKMNLWGCCMCFSRKVLDKALPFPEKLIAHDYWISIIAMKYFNCMYLDDCLIKYREHEDSVSYKKKTTLFYKLSYRLRLLKKIMEL